MLLRIKEEIDGTALARNGFSIRTKILIGCMSLTFVTILVGFLSQNAQTTLRNNTLEIYDDSFQSMNNIRLAQTIILEVSRDLAWGENNGIIFAEKTQSALDALDLANDRALSMEGERSTKMAMRSLANLQAKFKQQGQPPTRKQFKDIEQALDVAVGFYAADGFRLRGAAEELVVKTQVQIILAMLCSLIAAIIITLILSRAIVPSIRRAVSLATSIASGRLDNSIDRHGRSETGILLGALAVMQDSIAEKIACIEMLMAQQASGHASEIAVQHTRFETALNHMTIGLRMFGTGDRLLVQNRRFVEMFGAEPVNICLKPPALNASNDISEGGHSSRHYKCNLEDGRIIAIAEEAMPDGGRVVTYDDITEQQRAEAHLSHMVRHDALTGLPNRLLFRELMQTLTSASAPSAFSVVYLDLDHFKTVNDTLGHPVGDALLCETATRLLRAVEPADTVIRLGGDEFAIIQCSPAGDEAATALANQLLAVISQPFHIQGQSIAISASIGITCTSAGAETPDVLLKRADLALYAAKADGRGVYRFFEPEMDQRMQSRRTMEIHLRQAIAERQFELFYQPIVDTRNGGVVAFEALLRWRHPEQGMVSPADFIPIAEESGLILEIGRWVLNQACSDARHWPSHVKVAVNVSPLQFRSDSLIGDIKSALEASGLDARRLDVEITESLMMQRTDMTLSILKEIRALGVCISMDDFGTGYSSLSYLRCFPFDKIKIDRSFVQDLVESSDGMSIVKAVIQLGHSLRMKVVAEGVETKEQAALLHEAGCEEMQGYLFGRPNPALFAMALLGAENPAHCPDKRDLDIECQVALSRPALTSQRFVC